MTTTEKIQWCHDVEAARQEANEAEGHKMVLIEAFSPKCISCKNMEERTWSDDKVAQILETEFIPVQLNVLEDESTAKPPLLAFWTPTLIAMCPDGNIHRKWMGFLPPKEFLGEVALARVAYAMARQSFDEAHRLAQEATQWTEGDELRHSESLYWQAVSAYKASENQDLLIAGWKDLLARFPNSEWAKKVDFANSL
ncbi:hypothetical protein IAD21_02897 [Abditibacteriota bacterium]|nr:hypothetical protein IAD21_02897 [Abditibacteriota bacterium]